MIKLQIGDKVKFISKSTGITTMENVKMSMPNQIGYIINFQHDWDNEEQTKCILIAKTMNSNNPPNTFAFKRKDLKLLKP